MPGIQNGHCAGNGAAGASPSWRVGDCIGTDRYFKRDDDVSRQIEENGRKPAPLLAARHQLQIHGQSACV